MQVHGAARDLPDDLRNRHRMVKQVFACLKLVSIATVKDVCQCRVAIHDNFSFLQESNDCPGAHAMRNLDKYTFSQVSNSAPRLTDVENGPCRNKNQYERDNKELFHGILAVRLSR